MKKAILTILVNIVTISLMAQYCQSNAVDCDDSKCNNVQLIGTSQDINNNTVANGCETYSDHTSLTPADLTVGQSYTINITQGTCNGDYDRLCNAWIDYNNDGDFTDAGEALSSGNSSSPDPNYVHSFSFTIPSGAATGTTRLRVIVLEGGQANDPCAIYNWGETEDYNVEILPNNIPPTANFEANTTSTCSGLIVFSDLSTNTPTSWDWDFGDGSGSTQQNPTYTYTADGVYSVQLIVTNQYGVDSVTFTNYITVNTSGSLPITASCYPQTLSPSAGFGISNVTFSSINNDSGDGTNGYEDFTCNSATVISGVNYPISVTTDTPQPHNVRAWIDFNNDGSFSNSSELILSKDVSLLSQDTVFIPAAVVLNTPLRMRVMADWYFQATPDGCSDVENGQAEDYTIIIEENTNPPEAEFGTDITLSCNGDVVFTDQSTNIPTSWEWIFGDGTTTAQQNPTHHFDTSGTYSVTLVVTNDYGTDTITYSNLIEINYEGMVNPPNCTPVTTSYCCGYGIYRVNFIGINNSTEGGIDGYQDYTCSESTSADKGGCYVLEINTGTQNAEDLKVWIDFNNDSNFDDATELVLESYNQYTHSGIVIIPSSGIVTDTPLVMRVMSELIGNTIESCTNLQSGQTEDYAVTIKSATPVPTVFFSADVTSSCDGIINFTDESCGGGTSWLWNFGDGDTSTDQNPTHTYTDPGTYNISLLVSNTNGSNSDTIYQYIEVISLFGEPTTINCTPETNNPFDDIGIRHVIFNTINKWSQPGVDSYQDYSCTEQTVVDPGSTYSIYVTTSITYEEDVYVWIDFNNNGIFATSEQVFTSQFWLENHSGSITIPTSGITYGTSLRMRVWSDFSQGFSDPCMSPEYGQVEDYAIIIQDPSSPPIANFTVDSTLLCMGTVQFTNQSSNSATGFTWFFGDGGTSTLQNPSYTYTATGTYDVILIASNSNGNDTITFTNYIEYISDCDGVGIEENSIENSFTIFPNPTTGNFNIEFNNLNADEYSLRIVNVVGQLVNFSLHTQNDRSINIDISNQKSGVYFIQITHDTETYTKHILLKQ
ncbi:MAG: PKD domain-containing protein [Flavobacteriales bacterium]|nr:PKD domain-containing protein [Flavobacteriales bacterium]